MIATICWKTCVSEHLLLKVARIGCKRYIVLRYIPDSKIYLSLATNPSNHVKQ